MAVTILLNNGALSSLPALTSREPAVTTDQVRLYVGSAGGNRLLGLLQNNNGAAAPGVNDDETDGYSAGSTWTDVVNGKFYVCMDPTATAAVWEELALASGASGTVTSVDMTVPATLLSVSGNPVTTSGTLALSLVTQVQRTFLCGPQGGSPAAPTFRAIDPDDVPHYILNTESTPTLTGYVAAVDEGTSENAIFNVRKLLNLTPLRGYIDGHVLSRTTSSKVTVGIGACRDDTNAYTLVLASALAKSIQSIGSWTAGNDQNGLDTGAVANSTWYHVYVIGKTDGTTDVLISTSASAPTMPTGYTLKRRVGAVRTGAAGIGILEFVQTDDDFYWKTPVLDVNAANNPGTAAVTRTLTVPTGVKVKAILGVTAQGSAGYPAAVYFSDLALNDTTAGAGTASSFHTYSGLTAICGSPVMVWTNTSAQIRSRFQISDGSTYLWILTEGWVDPRGRNA